MARMAGMISADYAAFDAVTDEVHLRKSAEMICCNLIATLAALVTNGYINQWC
jgi:hypothetical protein